MSHLSKYLFSTIFFGNVGFILFHLYKKKIEKISENSSDEMIEIDNLELRHTLDRYGGIIIDHEHIPRNNLKLFTQMIEHSLIKWRRNRIRGIWLKIPVEYYEYISLLLSNNFQIHHSRPDYLMFTTWLDEENKSTIPDYVFTCIATRSFVVNRKGEIIVVTERFHNQVLWNWHLPGGVVDRGENLMVGAVREIKEETGIDTTFVSVISFRHTTPFRFNNTDDILFICLLKINDENQKFEPDHEIEGIKWMHYNDYFKDQETQEKEIMGHKSYQNRLEKEINNLVENWDNQNYISSCTFKPEQSFHPSHPTFDMQLYYSH